MPQASLRFAERGVVRFRSNRRRLRKVITNGLTDALLKRTRFRSRLNPFTAHLEAPPDTGWPIATQPGTTRALLGYASTELTRDTNIGSVQADARQAVEGAEKPVGHKWTQVPGWPSSPGLRPRPRETFKKPASRYSPGVSVAGKFYFKLFCNENPVPGLCSNECTLHGHFVE